MYSFFCCCFGIGTKDEASAPPPVSNVKVVNLTSNIVIVQVAQTNLVVTDDIVVLPPGLTDKISDDDKEELKEELKEEPKLKQSDNRFYMVPPATPASSPVIFKRPMTVSDQKVDKMYDYLLDRVNHSVTILLQLQIQNNIITPLKRGKYDEASNNFCRLFQVKKEVFDDYCKMFEIYAEEYDLISYSYQQSTF